MPSQMPASTVMCIGGFVYRAHYSNRRITGCASGNGEILVSLGARHETSKKGA